jgi:hypothetical protein
MLFWIYDAYIVETLASGLTQTWRPTNYLVDGVEMADPAMRLTAILTRMLFCRAADTLPPWMACS